MSRRERKKLHKEIRNKTEGYTPTLKEWCDMLYERAKGSDCTIIDDDHLLADEDLRKDLAKKNVT